jgi:S1-C subfamily serine protease
VITIDKRRDLALVEVDATGLSFARFGDEADPGEEVYAVGTPDGLEATVTRGIVSAYRKIDGVVLLQTDASINPGNSGGPIVSARTGEVIGIVREKDGKRAQGLAFAVAASELKQFLDARPASGSAAGILSGSIPSRAKSASSVAGIESGPLTIGAAVPPRSGDRVGVSAYRAQRKPSSLFELDGAWLPFTVSGPQASHRRSRLAFVLGPGQHLIAAGSVNSPL